MHVTKSFVVVSFIVMKAELILSQTDDEFFAAD
ncbi:hypothetical protein VISI1226_15516 [Vibrio sinaloensis DSM 21326]|uniref:Uncharacterized protein n=1 Tax=Vibrio sinaloensis DSM 21326 TaxID=945550 RepID=E8MCY6_PHOS4|nr:hypothetical protein VISI1226_15516 [Vibrio sinaloensis DSM 21326]